MDMATESVRELAPWSMLFADDIVLCAESKDAVASKLSSWMEALKAHGLKVNHGKTEYLPCLWGSDQRDADGLKIDEAMIKRVDKFRYLGSLLQCEGGVTEEVGARIQAGWNSWRSVSGVVCDRHFPVKLKGKIYRSIVRPALMYGSETLALNVKDERRLEVTEMKMLRWMCGVSRRDRVRNDDIRNRVGVTAIARKVQEKRLTWYGHVLRREEDYVGRRMMELQVQGSRGRGRPKRRWQDRVNEDLKEKGMSRGLVCDRVSWKQMVRNSDPAAEAGKAVL